MFGKEYVDPFQLYLSLSVCPLPWADQTGYVGKVGNVGKVEKVGTVGKVEK